MTIISRQSGPGDAALAGSWEDSYALDSPVWGDTTTYMASNFTIPLGGGMYPSAMVVDLETMTLRGYVTGYAEDAEPWIQDILDEDHPCAP